MRCLLKVALVVLVLALVGGTLCNAAQLVSDEATNLQALRAIFPNMRISVLPNQPEEHPSPITDPLQRLIATVQNELLHGRQYSVVGPVSQDEEDSSIDIVHPQRSASDERRLHIEVYRWTIDEKGNELLVAFLSYTFANANPPRCCTTVGKMVLLSDNAERVLDTLDKMPYAFTMFTSIQFLKVDATVSEMLLVGADFSGVGTIGINSAVFNVKHQRLNPLLWLTTMVLSEADIDDLDVHTMTLDARRTVLANGKRFFFTKKTYAVGKQVLTTPRTETAEFPVGSGVPLDWQ